MPEYDSRFDPPAPVAAINVRTVDRRKRVSNVSMFIDSGADVTVLPASVVSQLGLPNHGNREVTAFDGSESVAASVECEVLFLGQVYRGVYLVVDDQYGLLGRDVLNRVSLLLDGPRLTWEVT
ncbi:MAG: retroviral-like aspartic protease family protein [Thermoguttaceae bacterium]